jgi:16S rRNA processing protein RimM
VSAESFPRLTLARILRPWGRRGEVAAEIMTDFPKRLAKLREAWLSDDHDVLRSVRIRSCRIHLGQAVLLFEGIESINDAERLRGLELQVPLAERTPVKAGRYYISDLIGCTVWEENEADPAAAAPLGNVRDVQRIDPTAHAYSSDTTADLTSTIESWVLSVTTPEGELLVPLASEICRKIDIAARRIEVRLPEGLRGLNQT